MLIITGTIAYDYIMDFPGVFSDHILPDQLHKINLSFIVNKFERRRGGTAGNTSRSLGLLKTPHILFSRAGKDFGEYEKDFTRFGIDLKHVLIDRNTYTATGFAMTDKEDNQIWGFFYGASEKNYKLKLSGIATKKDLVLVGPSGAKSTMVMVKECIKNKISYMFDPGFILTQVTSENLALGFGGAKYVIGNDYEIALIKKRVKNFEKEAKRKIVIITLGKKGALILDHGEKIAIEPCSVKKAIDPTGAGDAWRSGFLAGLDRRFDLKTCGRMGAVAASFAVEHYGTQVQNYTIKQFEKRYLKNYKYLLHL